jgi:hypothetical protein
MRRIGSTAGLYRDDGENSRLFVANTRWETPFLKRGGNKAQLVAQSPKSCPLKFAFLASEESKFITAQQIYVDGGGVLA